MRYNFSGFNIMEDDEFIELIFTCRESASLGDQRFTIIDEAFKYDNTTINQLKQTYISFSESCEKEGNMAKQSFSPANIKKLL